VRVAVLSGGRSSEHEISLASGAAVRAGLADAGHEAVDVLIDRSGTWSADGAPIALTPGGGLLDADVVFPVLHGPFGEDGTVQGLLDLLDVPYVGAGVLASALCMEKVTFKDLMQVAGLPQVDYVALRDGDSCDGVAQRLGLPCFVKPARLGSSVGISKATTETELESALRVAWDHDPLAIVEAMATGLEIECSVIGNAEPEASQPGEIAINADWYDYAAKYDPGGMELVVPARVDPTVRERVRDLARDVFLRVGCTGLARVDFFVTEGGEVLVNELNTMPGFTPTSVFGKLWDASGLPYPELLDRLLALAVERFERERSYSF
jgi:D-alanine-D-alanine ligase